MAQFVCDCNIPLRLELGVDGGSTGNTIPRRTGKHHPNLWSDDYIQSLTSPYGASIYVERRDRLIKEISDMFKGVGEGEGEFSPSPYDTAWVAMIPAIDNLSAPARPHFPQTLDWILQNQQDDGSWGLDDSSSKFSLPDRLLNTLACILPLVTWETGHQNVNKGVQFIRRHIESMTEVRLPIDFEIVFPELLNQARLLKLDLPYDLTWLEQIRIGRHKRLSKICKETFHTDVTPLLYSLEGLQEIVDWKRIMNLQSAEGSFLSSPSSTACAFINTGDNKCLDYLTNTLNKFGNFVPCMYPLDIFERIWTVDVVQRLGIDHYFKEEIKVALDYTYKYWNQNVIVDLNTAALGFRILRFNGYNVSEDALQIFKDEDGHFFCCSGPGQAHRELSSMLNLYRASELDFPSESILKEARAYASTYLQDTVKEWEDLKLEKTQLFMEIEYALKFPWRCNIPRWEATNYIEIFRRDNQTRGCVPTCLYKIPIGYSEKMFELAVLDFNIFQSQQQSELKLISTWWKNSSVFHLDFFRHRHVEFYFWWVCSLFEHQFSASRIGFTKLVCSLSLIDDIYDTYGTLDELKPFTKALIGWDPSIIKKLPDYMKTTFEFSHQIHKEIASEAERKHGPIVHTYIRDCWESYILSYLQEAEWIASNYIPNFDRYLENGTISSGMRVVTMHSLMLMDTPLSDEILKKVDFPSSNFQYHMSLLARLVDDMNDFQDEQERGELASCVECYMKENIGSTKDDALKNISARVDRCLQQLNWEFLNSLDIPVCCRNLYFNAGSRGLLFLYKDVDGLTFSHHNEIKNAITKVIFEPIVL